MISLKALGRLALVTASFVVSADGAPGSTRHAADAHPALAISEVDQRFLTQVARRSVEAKLRGHPPYRPGYVPPILESITCQIIVTLREGGYARGIGTSTNLPIVAAAQEAAMIALSSARGGQDPLSSLEGVRFEMQTLGPLVDYAGSQNWTVPGATDGFLEPGVHGVRLFLDGEGRWFTPAEMISRCLSLDEAVRTLGKEVSLDSQVLNESRLSRFRTLHWWEIDDEGRVVTLRRGMLPVAQEDVNRRTLDKAIRELAEYIAYRQRPDGWFSATFNPAADKYAQDDDPVMHSGACWALAAYAARADSPSARDHVERGLRVLQSALVDLPTHDGAAYIATFDQVHPLGLTAQCCLALSAPAPVNTFASLRPRLIRGMLWLQQKEGYFLSVFPPSLSLEPQERSPGMALLALADSYRLEPSTQIADAVSAALPFYRDWFERTGALAMAPWHAQAYAQMSERTRRSDYAEFVFELCDRISANQLRPENYEDAVLWGAIANAHLSPGSSTAAFVSGLADGAVLARNRGDNERHARYVDACRRGARFILQLQFKPDECYYVRSPRDAVGGIRSSPTNVRIHLDSCQHALLALMKCRDLLYPDPAWSDQP